MERDRYYFWALSLIFITLKLTGTIDWSWWLVMSPIWGPFLVGLGPGALRYRQEKRTTPGPGRESGERNASIRRDAPMTRAARTSVMVTPHEVIVRITGVPHLVLRRSGIVGVQGYIKNIGPVAPIHFVEVTTRTGQIISDYADRSLWVEVLNGLAEARLFDERLGEKE